MLHGRILRLNKKAMTLMELLIALILLSMIVLGIGNLEIFCRHAFLGTDRKTKVTNDATYIVEHMSKFIGKAVGDALNFPVNGSNTMPAGCDASLSVWTDYSPTAGNENGIVDSGDRQVVYCFNNAAHEMRFYPDYVILPGSFEVLSRNMENWNLQTLSDFRRDKNYVNVNVTTCWDVSIPCGTVDNPRVTLETRIVMPSVSVNATP
jgi:prepilin-type N-terminal cleavage/methylation domain-containing protein